MTAVVRLALSRPYTFVVMAILVMIFGALSIFRTQTDIFPNIGIPVISVVWGFTGLSPDDMTGRIVSPYERVLSTTVNDIQHIESQSFPGMGVVKCRRLPEPAFIWRGSGDVVMNPGRHLG